MHGLICQKFAASSDGRWSAEELSEFSRIWKFEGNETLDDAKQMLTEIGSDLSKLPLPIQARILTPETLIDDARIADNELIVMEMMVVLDKTSA